MKLIGFMNQKINQNFKHLSFFSFFQLKQNTNAINKFNQKPNYETIKFYKKKCFLMNYFYFSKNHYFTRSKSLPLTRASLNLEGEERTLQTTPCDFQPPHKLSSSF